MTAFDRLHPALQHHVVNSMGWKSLRPLQEQAIDPILAGEHALLLAPTAGGKTEAAILPLLSRMLAEDWRGLSILYVCPIRALLNNLEVRLSAYCEFVGRRAALWHGDVGQGARRRFLREPADILLTTPESIEVMLVSRKTDERQLFAGVQAVVVDEMHAFAGDDRGWHLLAVLERVAKLAGRDLQRIGLSATVGNANDLLDWLGGGSKGPRRVIAPEAESTAECDVTIDSVGTVNNAARVISQLHRGEKRLVFCDSRSKVEQLSVELRRLGVETHVSHSSLSVDARRQAEAAFAEGRNCVIVATSTLELGIDVGDLDRVIQLDAPSTVASFLQRLGRTGRRSDAQRNCLFLATNPGALLQACALTRLWKQGFVEPVTPPPAPFHILAQQIMALALQEGGITRHAWREWVGGVPGFAELDDDSVEAVLDHMLSQGILWDDEGVLWFGKEGEATFGHRHFMELLSVFTSPPMFTVLHGRAELGLVHQSTFQVRRDEPTVLLLGGRSWRLRHVDWKRKVAYVEPAAGERGKSRWPGDTRPLHQTLCRSVQAVLAGDSPGVRLTKRAEADLKELREDFHWVDEDSTVLLRDSDGETSWWTFAGLLANWTLAASLGPSIIRTSAVDNYRLPLAEGVALSQAEERIRELVPSELTAGWDPSSADALKFSECLSEAALQTLMSARLGDARAVDESLNRPRRIVS